MIEDIKTILQNSKGLYDAITQEHLRTISDISNIVAKTIASGNKIILFGNGGSAADSQHIACELVGKFSIPRRPYPAIALTTNTSNLTAIANDFSFEEVFKRQVAAFVNEGDLVWGFTTSGDSSNVIEGIKEAKKLGATTLVFTGKDGGKIKSLTDFCFIVPSDNTPRIQEFHILTAHIICELIESKSLVDANQS